jgi:hypothetical protein
MKDKASYLWLVLFVLAVVFFFYAQNKGAAKRQLILSKGKKSIGTIHEVAGEYLKCKYEINGTSYVFGREVPYQYLEDGEQYGIRYLPEDPDYIVIEFDKPVFSREFVFLEVTPSHVEKMDLKFRYEYLVDNQHYERLQLGRSEHSLSPQNYVVRYRKDKPEIGYLVELE